MTRHTCDERHNVPVLIAQNTHRWEAVVLIGLQPTAAQTGGDAGLVGDKPILTQRERSLTDRAAPGSRRFRADGPADLMKFRLDEVQSGQGDRCTRGCGVRSSPGCRRGRRRLARSRPAGGPRLHPHHGIRARRHAERAQEWMICVIQRDSPAKSFRARNRQGGIVSIRDHAQ
jgi:hypothetical protein